LTLNRNARIDHRHWLIQQINREINPSQAEIQAQMSLKHVFNRKTYCESPHSALGAASLYLILELHGL